MRYMMEVEIHNLHIDVTKNLVKFTKGGKEIIMTIKDFENTFKPLEVTDV